MLQKLFSLKDKHFLPLFTEQADCINEAGNELLAIFQTQKQVFQEEKQKNISLLEHKGDRCVQDILHKLYHVFFAPYDHEDIKDLTLKLDDILDEIDAVSSLVILYKLERIEKYMETFGELIQKITSETSTLIHSMKDMKKCRFIFDKINNFEHEGDRLLSEALYGLFQKQNDPLTIIKHKEIYERLESITDRCKDASDIIEAIVLKYM